MAQQARRKRNTLPPKKRKRVQIPDDQIRYTNVEGLKRFLSDRGKIRSRRMTGLSRRQQALAAREIKRAREMGLLPFVMPKLERARAAIGRVCPRGPESPWGLSVRRPDTRVPGAHIRLEARCQHDTPW